MIQVAGSKRAGVSASDFQAWVVNRFEAGERIDCNIGELPFDLTTSESGSGFGQPSEIVPTQSRRLFLSGACRRRDLCFATGAGEFNGTTGYIGVRFSLGSRYDWHYGWAAYSGRNRVSGGRLIGWAFHPVPNAPIRAGAFP